MNFTNTSNILGYQGESLAREITFIIDEGLSNCDIYLEFIKPDGKKIMTNEVVTSPYLVPYSLLDEVGYLKAQLVAYRGTTFIQKSSIKSFYIADSINASQTIEEDNLSIINELIEGVANSVNDLNFSFNNETKILTTTLYFNDDDTSTKTVNINIDSGDKYIINVSIDYENEIMIFTFNDGTTISCDITPLIDMYSADNLTLKLESGVFSLSDNYKSKIDGISNNANKVEASEINGNIKIDNTETKVYELPNNVVTDNAYVHTDNNFTTEYKNQVDSNTVARHTHSNKTILDNTTASFTTEWKTQTETDISSLEQEINGESDLSTISEYSSRETANGNFFIDGSSSTLHSVKGKSVKSGDTIYHSHFAGLNEHSNNLISINEQTLNGAASTILIWEGDIEGNVAFSCLIEYTSGNPSAATIQLIKGDNTEAYVTPSNMECVNLNGIKKIKILNWGSLVGTVKNFMLVKGTYNAQTMPEYHSYATDNIIFEDTELKGIGTAKDELNFDTNKKITRIGSIDLGSLNYTYYAGYQGFYTQLSLAKKLISGANIANITLVNYTSVSDTIFSSTDTDMEIALNVLGNFKIRNLSYTDPTLFKTAMAGKILYYELATPSEEYFIFEDNTIQAFINGTEEIVNSNSIYGALTTQEQSYPSTIISSIANLEKNKVDVIEGKCLSTNDFTNEDKTKLDSLEQVITALTGTSDNPIYFQDLETGNYVLNGRYKPYESASISGNATNQFIQVNRSSSRVNVFMVDARSEELECFEIQIDTDEFVRTIIPIPEINLNKMPVDDAMDGIYAQMQNQLKYENSVEQTLMIDISFPTDIPNNYYSKLVFKTGSTIPTFNLTGTVKWLGDSITGNQLILQANKIYTINFEKDVFELVARVEMR